MSENFTKMLEFMSLVGHLKHVRRTGWVQKKVGVGGGPESVADHMYRMAVLSFLVDPGAGLDKHRCMKIALVHDMAECIVGDITPQDGISKEDKHKKEKTAMKHICSLVEESVGQEIYSLWQEYEDQSSKEAEFIKDIDRFEMILQAFEYEQMDMKPRYLQDFFDSTKGYRGSCMSIQEGGTSVSGKEGENPREAHVPGEKD
ncbi:5'-deoxynucleotidase HDDC2-like isoform X3 [Haliotis rufescens]|uniref:5'-deoxynucleotidase HDDC2-like isoform X3 n=1 Tax=Haliotis rufescens TaxID=6454 RepID=UPI001EB077CF|nr:5'-deoxynucleotidase HDDC2-like isoform X3 [Haliotis rufescens]